MACQSPVRRGGSSHRQNALYVEAEPVQGEWQSSLEIQSPGGVTKAFRPGSSPAWGVRGQGARPYLGLGHVTQWQCLIERKGASLLRADEEGLTAESDPVYMGCQKLRG